MQKAIQAQVVDVPGAYILTSCRHRANGPDSIEVIMTFFWTDGEIAAEWEPQYGPVMKWFKCSKEHPKAREHFFFDFVEDEPLQFSQLAVSREGLKEAFLRGNYRQIFAVLKRWACR